MKNLWLIYIVWLISKGTGDTIFGVIFTSKGYPFKNIFDFTTSGARGYMYVVVVDRLPVILFIVDLFSCLLDSRIPLCNPKTLDGH